MLGLHFEQISTKLDIKNFFLVNDISIKFDKLFCGMEFQVSRTVCIEALYFLYGRNEKNQPQVDLAVLPKILKYESKAFGSKQVSHYLQMMHSGKFRAFDHKREENKRLYNGSATPPNYDLTQVIAPSYLYHAGHDLLNSALVIINYY